VDHSSHLETFQTSVAVPAHERRCYLAYLTANDSGLFIADYLNFRHMVRFPPGVRRVIVYVAVSVTKPLSQGDYLALEELATLTEQCDWLDVRRILLKGNVGRDFSSAEACLQAIAEEASPEDYVMVRNRSAYGPQRENWYRDYVDQFERFSDTGLVGSTINFTCHLPVQGLTTHVQTYAYLSTWKLLQPLAAASEHSRARPWAVLFALAVGAVHARASERRLPPADRHQADEFQRSAAL
jgi:hypothetical protein